MRVTQAIDVSNRDFIGSLAKGLKVITTFSAENDQMTLSDIARNTDMTRAGARRILLTLNALGYVSTDGKKFSLSPKILELGYSFLNSQGWLSMASPRLEALRDELNECVSLTVLDGTEVLYVAKFAVRRVMTISMDMGSRRPAFCTAMGRVLLSELPEDALRAVLDISTLEQLTRQTETDPDRLVEIIRDARQRGHSTVNQELEPGLVAISVPLRNAHGEILSAVNVCGHNSELSLADLEGRCLDALKRTVADISVSLF